MKFLHYLFFFLVGLLGVWLGGILIPLCWEGIVFNDTVFSSLGTWIGSIGTIGTLVFLIKQNQGIIKSQKESNEKQREMWNTQKEIISFQKIQTHTELFEDMLSDLEHNLPIKFVNRKSLYRKIFPHNNFDNCSPIVSLAVHDDQVHAGDLSDIRDATIRLKKYLEEFSEVQSKSGESYKHTHDFLSCILSITALLHIDIIAKEETGNISVKFNTERFLLNVFAPEETLYCIQEVVNGLMAFTGNENSFEASISHMSSSFLLESLQDFAYGNTNHRGFILSMDKEFGSVVDYLYEFKQALSNIDDYEAFKSIKYMLNNIFYNKSEMLSLLASRSEVIDFLCKIRVSLAKYCVTEEHSLHFDELRAKVTEIAKDVGNR